MTELAPHFIYEPVPDHPGWFSWELKDTTRFNGLVLGKTIVRKAEDGRVWTRMFPTRKHTNLTDSLHGGTILSLIDVSLFSAAQLNGLINAGPAVTLELSTQFLAAGKADVPLDSIVELLRETRRLLFLRGVVEQDGETISAFSALIRKASA